MKSHMQRVYPCQEEERMPIGEIAMELLGGTIRVVSHIVIEIVLEILIRGPGYLICRMLRKGIDPESGWVVLAGVMFWMLMAIGGYFSYMHI
jgi:hypothetical protein